VVVDVAESVRLIQQDELGTIDHWRRLVNEVRSQVLPAHGGRLVKSLGDGMLLEFESARAGVAASLQVQARAEAFNLDRDAHSAVQLRVGVRASDVLVDELDVYGAGVNLAARLCTLAEPGEVVVSAAVRDERVPGLDGEMRIANALATRGVASHVLPSTGARKLPRPPARPTPVCSSFTPFNAACSFTDCKIASRHRRRIRNSA
jgi:class 3 adenylate cyclase